MGYGFVQYQKAEAAQKALRQLQVRLCFSLKLSLLFSHNQAKLLANTCDFSQPFTSTVVWMITS